MAVVRAHSEDATLRLDPTSVAPDGAVFISGEGLDPYASLRLTLEGQDARVALGDITIGLAGAFENTVLVPADVPPGVYSIRLSEDGVLVLSEVLVVDPAAGSGVPVDRGPPAVLIVLLAVIFGVGLLVGLRSPGRRRRRQAPRGDAEPAVDEVPA